MKQIAIEKARERLDKAAQNLMLLEASRSYFEFQRTWTDFLLALNSIHTFLEKGANSNPKSMQWWYGDKKKERKKDPLLSYLKQARNADEHGLEPITELKPGGIQVGAGATLSLRPVIRQGSLGFEHIEGPGLAVVAARAALVPVYDSRQKKWVDVPAEHLGLPLPDQSVPTIARAGYKYHAALLEAATRLVT